MRQNNYSSGRIACATNCNYLYSCCPSYKWESPSSGLLQQNYPEAHRPVLAYYISQDLPMHRIHNDKFLLEYLLLKLLFGYEHNQLFLLIANANDIVQNNKRQSHRNVPGRVRLIFEWPLHCRLNEFSI